MPGQKSLSEVLPPLFLGTGTFNTQFHPDPEKMPYTEIVRLALENGVRGFDTSPFYGPSEILLGQALKTLSPARDDYFIATKAGRIAGAEFDYSPEWIRKSVNRSLERLNTPYVDIVYAHDTEYVSPEEVLEAVKELRSLRDEGKTRYVGISGYPVDVLASLTEMIVRETGEAPDAVLSYGHFCLQNDELGQDGLLKRFKEAGVTCLLNAGLLNMGLLTSRGADGGLMAAWHPAPPELRKACHGLAAIAAEEGEQVEKIAIHWALENWAKTGGEFGTRAHSLQGGAWAISSGGDLNKPVGASIIGITAPSELLEACKLWESVLKLVIGREDANTARSGVIDQLVRERMWPSLGKWKNYSWPRGTRTRTV